MKLNATATLNSDEIDLLNFLGTAQREMLVGDVMNGYYRIAEESNRATDRTMAVPSGLLALITAGMNSKT